MGRFEGRACVVTGGARGIGRAVVELLLREGGSVVIADIDAEEAQRTAAELAASAPGRVLALGTDVARREDVRAAVAAALGRFGRLDVMIAHAGIADVEPFLEQDEDSFAKMLAVNVTGAFLCIQEAARVMKDAGGGAIVVTGSTNAFWTESNAAAYNASKGGVVALMRSAALDLAPFGIRVNSVAPGLIRTRLTRYVTDIPEHAEDYLAKIPLDRFGEPADVADAIAFLASDAARWITGVDLPVDGGQTIGTPLPLPDEPFVGSARADRARESAVAGSEPA
jgi:NAD(P)-dependent dehydrogenase (short-subunit alcohol dehydrogenase family)